MDRKQLAFLTAIVILFLSAVFVGCAQEPDPELVALQATVAALSAQNAEIESAIATQTYLIRYLFTRPAPVITPVGPDTPPTPYRPVAGAVLIEDGSCCVGGPAGEALDITISLNASSPVAEVTGMRLAIGSHFLTEEEMEGVPWEPFVPQKTITLSSVPINWSGRYASVQFRDAIGNLSAVVHDDISVEGEPR